ncbi:hypothetical protein M569_03038, partial [Genlisea aurea]
PPPPSSEKKSFTVATGELFLGIAARVFRSGSRLVNGAEKSAVELPQQEEGERWWRRRTEDKIGAVVDDPDRPAAIEWEQREQDVEAERRRTVVTSPGFSFSAAGLLLPYHLGVAQFLLEKGYIKETTPLAGASAGAILCVIVASGATMEEALKATK